jgi:hypothetical protein
MTNRRRARLAAFKKPGAKRAPKSTVNPNYALDDKRRSHGAPRAKGADRNGPVGDHGQKGKPPKFAHLVDGRDRYGTRPRSHKTAGWA